MYLFYNWFIIYFIFIYLLKFSLFFNEFFTYYIFSGDLVQDLKVFNVNGQLTTMSFTLGLVVPIFSSNPNVEIYLATSALQIRKNLELEGNYL